MQYRKYYNNIKKKVNYLSDIKEKKVKKINEI